MPSNSTTGGSGKNDPAAPPGYGDFPTYLTTTESAAFLRCSKSYLDKLRVTGGGPSYLKPSGGKVLYTRPDLIDWVESRRRRATNEYR